jgi:EAL domain-containing protein (putative c-di-GMP-specific phosphodiesterase class I)
MMQTNERLLASEECDGAPPFIIEVSAEHRLREALAHGEFLLHYQPKVDAATRSIAGFEALIRWRRPNGELLSPAEFVPVAEETGFVVELGEWALAQAARDQRAWLGAGVKAPKVAVNVSAVQLRDPGFIVALERALGEAAAPAALELELTETAVMHDVETSIAKLEAARRLGLGIAIDDFGIGYSSLSYLARLPADALKIDRSFVSTMTASTVQATVVRSIVSLAHSLRMKVTAEGVETEKQAKMLALLGCDAMQGYLFGMPLPRNEVPALLETRLLPGRSRRPTPPWIRRAPLPMPSAA